MRNAVNGESAEALAATFLEFEAGDEALVAEIAKFPQGCLRADRASVYAREALSALGGLRLESAISAGMVAAAGMAGVRRFADGKGRHGNFEDF
ncbi:MAG: hypothetical protein RLW61_09955 [Gammaproteobacteria bacterium]